MAEITAPPVQIGRLITALGTITADTKVLDSTVTWNAAVTFTAWKLNVTDTSSNAASLLADLQVGGASKWKVDKTGAVTQAQGHTITAGGLTVSAGTTAVQALTATVGTFTPAGVSNPVRIDATSTTYGGISFNNSFTTTGMLGVQGGGAADNNLYLRVPTGGAIKFVTNNGIDLVCTAGALSGVTTLNMSGNLTLSGYGAGGGLVSVGAADSGGAGFKLLRVPN